MPATLDHVRSVYAQRAATMGAALQREFGDGLAFNQPKGGLFFWARLTGAHGQLNDGATLAKKAIDQGVAFVPGAPFFSDHPDTTTLRLSFATADVAKIEEGLQRLGRAFRGD
jgi:DNA-binding transcriptional MocR family regulator